MKRILLLAAIAATLAAQDTASAGAPGAAVMPTTFAGHRIGESLQEWLSVSGLDLSAACDGRNAVALARLNKLIPAPSHVTVGNPITAEEIFAQRSSRASLCDKIKSIQAAGTGQFETRQDISETWHVVAGKIAEVQIYNPLTNSNAEEQLGFLRGKYGVPAVATTETYQNALGAKWELPAAKWEMPDGAAIFAREYISDLQRRFSVIFQSKERVRQTEDEQKQKANPYK